MTINEAILKVLTAQFKKDEPEAFEMVSNHGYIISKWHGQWDIKNEATDRYLFGGEEERWNSRRGRYVLCLHLRCGGSTVYDKIVWNADKFDYVGYLNKPLNRWVLNEQGKFWQEKEWSEARRTYECIRSAKSDIKRYTQNLEETKQSFQRKIQKLADDYQWNVSFYTNSLKSARERLSELRKENGLKERD